MAKAPRKPKQEIVIQDQITWSAIWTIGSKVVTAVVLLASFVGAWLYLGFWRPASHQELLDELQSYDSKIKPRVIEAQSLGLKNRLEILNLNRQSIDRERIDLEIKQKTIKDPAAQSIINERMRNISKDAVETDRAIQDTQDAIKKEGGK